MTTLWPSFFDWIFILTGNEDITLKLGQVRISTMSMTITTLGFTIAAVIAGDLAALECLKN